MGAEFGWSPKTLSIQTRPSYPNGDTARMPIKIFGGLP